VTTWRSWLRGSEHSRGDCRPDGRAPVVTIADGLGLLIAIVVIATIADRLRIAYPILLVIAGVVIALLPVQHRVELQPDWVLLAFLPPLIYDASLDTSARELRTRWRPVLPLAVGLVAATMATVAVVVGVAFALGAIVSPPDSVAATQIAGKLGLPRRLVTILGGEGLMNDATALTAYQLAIAAVDATPCSRVRVEVDGVSCRSSSSAKDADDRNACLLEGGSVDGCTGGTLAALLVVTGTRPAMAQPVTMSAAPMSGPVGTVGTLRGDARPGCITSSFPTLTSALGTTGPVEFIVVSVAVDGAWSASFVIRLFVGGAATRGGYGADVTPGTWEFEGPVCAGQVGPATTLPFRVTGSSSALPASRSVGTAVTPGGGGYE